jgi:DNA polymerase-3 subunit alpha
MPESFEDLIIILSLNRPGTKRKIEEFQKRKILKKKEKNKNFFNSEDLNKILEESYGLIIFEEQITKIFSFLLEISFSDAEIKRREIKEKGFKEKEEQEFRLSAKNKIDEEDLEKIIEGINSTISYTFNKSHAVAYAHLSYYIAYLKANHFEASIIELLKKYKEKESLLKEAFFLDYNIESPDINNSEDFFCISNKSVFFGFNELKSYNSAFFQRVIEERKSNGNYTD